MRISTILAGLLAASSLSTVACAQDGEDDGKGFHVGLSGGIAAVQDTDIRYYDRAGTFGGNGSADSAHTRIHIRSAAQFKCVPGYDFGVIPTDVEIAYQRNRTSTLSINKVNGTAVTLDAGDVAGSDGAGLRFTF